MHPLRLYIQRFVPLTDADWEPLAAALRPCLLALAIGGAGWLLGHPALLLAGTVLLFHLPEYAPGARGQAAGGSLAGAFLWHLLKGL